MNLYLIGWNLPKEHYSLALAEMRNMTKIFPKIDPETLWHYSSECGTIFAASMHTNKSSANPRIYVKQSDDQVVFYSGLPIHSKGTYPAHRAEALSDNWDQLSEDLEGHFLVARAGDNPPRLEILTDFIGVEQAFYFRDGESWLISNSVHLIERVTGPKPIDPMGASLFIGLSWVASDCSLRSNIKVVPGGQHWSWQVGRPEPEQRAYYHPSRLASLPNQKLNSSFYQRLADDMMQPCYSLGKEFDNIKCTLTGGRDSRLMAALLIRTKLQAQYYIFGDRTSTDATVAKLISETFNLPFEYVSISTEDIIKNWDSVSMYSVRQNDGMRSFNIMPTVLMSNLDLHDDLHNRNLWGDNLNLSFWGNGGELARGFYSKTNFYMTKHNKESIINFLFSTRILRNDGLILQDGIELVQEYLRDFVTQAIDYGFPLIDIPDVLYAYQRAARRGGLSARGSSQIRDVFSPCCSRPFVEAAFSMPALQRYTQPLHYNLTRLLSPGLFNLPLDKDPWHFQHPLVNLLHVYSTEKLKSFRSKISKLKGDSKVKDSYKKSTIFDDIRLFEAKREEMREICLDQNKDSSLWNIVDRSRFDKITSSDFDPANRKKYVNMLHRIVTLCYYDADDLRYAAPARVEQ